jgi:thymidylate kinase
MSLLAAIKNMLYVFEGPRNSGKTHFSKMVSDRFKIQRFQFSFAEYFKRLGMQSQNSKEAHSFALGKELMIMQLVKDFHTGFEDDPLSFIHDRGILSVLAWGLLEKRISESEMEIQVKLLKDLNLLDKVKIILVTGKNPSLEKRNKDQWDGLDGDIREMDCYERVIGCLERHRIGSIWKIQNNFDSQSEKSMIELFEHILFD